MADAMRVSRELNAQGVRVTLDVLGEFIKSLDEAEANKQEYLDLIEETQKNGINGNYSLKPTSFGLLLDKEACYRLMREIVAKAASYNNFCRIDMETPEIPTNYRLCKGIYIEPAEIAYKKYEEINKHYLEDLEFMFRNKIYVGIATHDKPLIEGAYELIRKYNVPKNMYEFQMLYGVTPKLRQSIVDGGHLMRVYVPFGEKWFGYSTRRLKENPKIASHIIKAIFVKG